VGAGILSRTNRLVVVMLSAIGDAVHVLPVVNALKSYRPDLYISWVIQTVPGELVKGHEAVDEFIIFQRRRGRALWGPLRQTAARIQEGRFDLALGLQVYLKAGFLLGRSGAKVKLGFDRRRARDLQWFFSTHRIPARPGQHVQDQYFEFLDYLQVPRGEPRWDIRFTSTELEARTQFFSRYKRPVCAVVVGTSKPQKNWSPEKLGEVVTRLDQEFGVQSVLVGGPSRTEQQLAQQITAAAACTPGVELVDNVRRLSYLLSGSRFVISPDTGPLHIARALDVPVVGLYGYTNPKRTGPYRKFQDLVVDGYARFPGEEYPLNMEYRNDGMSRIEVEAVLAKVRLAIDRYRQPGGCNP
jgi:heptosyltransferase I